MASVEIIGKGKFSNKIKRALSVPERHQLRIARDTMKMSCAGARIMGGMGPSPHRKAAEVIHTLTGVTVGVDSDCSCF